MWDCRATGLFNSTWGLTYDVTGHAAFPDRYYRYYFKANLADTLYVNEVSWWALYPTE